MAANLKSVLSELSGFLLKLARGGLAHYDDSSAQGGRASMGSIMKLNFADVALELDKCRQPLDLQTIFSRPGPVEIEIGTGKGTFLLNQAKLFANVNFLGIEWANKFYQYAVDRMCRWGMTNVRLLRADARDFLAQWLPAESIRTYHVYFPDPWFKKRHLKRRFFTPDNLRQIIRTLVPGGSLRVATDYQDYFAVIRELLLENPEIAPHFSPAEFYPAQTASPGEWVGTNFERKYLKEGRAIYTLAVKKR